MVDQLNAQPEPSAIDMLLGLDEPAPQPAPAPQAAPAQQPTQAQPQQPAAPAQPEPNPFEGENWFEQQQRQAQQQQPAAQQPAPTQQPTPAPATQPDAIAEYLRQNTAALTRLAQQQPSAQPEQPKTFQQSLDDLKINVPDNLLQMMQSPEPGKAQEALGALLSMAVRQAAAHTYQFTQRDIQTAQQQNQQTQAAAEGRRRFETRMTDLHPKLVRAVKASPAGQVALTRAMQEIASDPQWARAQLSDGLINAVARRSAELISEQSQALAPFIGGNQQRQQAPAGQHPQLNGGNANLPTPGGANPIGDNLDGMFRHL